MELTDAQWSILEPLLPKGKSGAGKRGRPRRDDRQILEGILWVLRTGARWKDLPKELPPYQTCHDRFTEWVDGGTLDAILRALLADLQQRDSASGGRSRVRFQSATANSKIVAPVITKIDTGLERTST